LKAVLFGKTTVDYLSAELLGYKAQLGVNGTFGLKLALEMVSGSL